MKMNGYCLKLLVVSLLMDNINNINKFYSVCFNNTLIISLY